MSFRSKMALTSMLGLSAVLCKAQQKTPGLPDSVVIAKTGYVVKPYDEKTAVEQPANIALHGSYSSVHKSIWMDKQNYALFIANKTYPLLVEKLTAKIQSDVTKDTACVSGGFWTVLNNVKTIASPTNQVIIGSGWKTSHAADKKILTETIITKRHHLDEFETTTSALNHLDLGYYDAFAVERKEIVGAGRAPLTGPSLSAAPMPADTTRTPK